MKSEREKFERIGRQAMNIQVLEAEFCMQDSDGKPIEGSKSIAMIVYNLEKISQEDVMRLLDNGMYQSDSRILKIDPETFANIFPHSGEAESMDTGTYWRLRTHINGLTDYECSACGFNIPVHMGASYHYCPYCGAKMADRQEREETSMSDFDTQEELELTDQQLERMDDLDNAAHEYLKVLTNNPDMEWDQHYIGELNEMAADMMCRKGFRIYYPYIETNEDGTQRRVDFYEPDEQANGNIRHDAYWNEARFGEFGEDGAPEGFQKYEAKIRSHDTHVIDIWARSQEEAMLIADDLTEYEIRQFGRHINAGCRIEIPVDQKGI